MTWIGVGCIINGGISVFLEYWVGLEKVYMRCCLKRFDMGLDRPSHKFAHDLELCTDCLVY